MVGRRGFLTGLLASGLTPALGWADAGSPAYLAAAKLPDGAYALCGLDVAGTILFRIPIPGRGHAATAHPTRPEAVAFARRPGVFATILNCATGQEFARLQCPDGRHFYGHGAFSADGETLFTTENDYEAGQGRIGIWDARRGFARIGEFDSGGIGPHEIKRVPGADVMVVANGGIDTHPEAGRTKLNLPTMRANLCYLNLAGEVLDQVDLPKDMQRNSIRHLDVTPDGQVAFGMQWQGDLSAAPALVGLHRVGAEMMFLQAPDQPHRQAQGYVGSIAWSVGADQVAVTCPRGGSVQTFDAASGGFRKLYAVEDASGLVGTERGFLVTSGTGQITEIATRSGPPARHDLNWDNHLVRI